MRGPHVDRAQAFHRDPLPFLRRLEELDETADPFGPAGFVKDGSLLAELNAVAHPLARGGKDTAHNDAYQSYCLRPGQIRHNRTIPPCDGTPGCTAPGRFAY